MVYGAVGFSLLSSFCVAAAPHVSFAFLPASPFVGFQPMLPLPRWCFSPVSYLEDDWNAVVLLPQDLDLLCPGKG